MLLELAGDGQIDGPVSAGQGAHSARLGWRDAFVTALTAAAYGETPVTPPAACAADAAGLAAPLPGRITRRLAR